MGLNNQPSSHTHCIIVCRAKQQRLFFTSSLGLRRLCTSLTSFATCFMFLHLHGAWCIFFTPAVRLCTCGPLRCTCIKDATPAVPCGPLRFPAVYCKELADVHLHMQLCCTTLHLRSPWVNEVDWRSFQTVGGVSGKRSAMGCNPNGVEMYVHNLLPPLR